MNCSLFRSCKEVKEHKKKITNSSKFILKSHNCWTKRNFTHDDDDEMVVPIHSFTKTVYSQICHVNRGHSECFYFLQNQKKTRKKHMIFFPHFQMANAKREHQTIFAVINYSKVKN